MINDSPFNKTKKDSGAPDSATLFISLYLVVLAFFLMLNSMALISEQRSKAAVNSLNKAFEGKMGIPTLQRDKRENLAKGQDLGLSEYFTMVKATIEETIQVTDAKMDLQVGTMVLTVPSHALFVPETANILEEKIPTLQKLAANLTPRKPGVFVELECILHTPHFLDRKNDVFDWLDTFRAAMFARTMIAFGVPANTVSTGVTPNREDKVVLTFHVRSSEGAENRLKLE